FTLHLSTPSLDIPSHLTLLDAFTPAGRRPGTGTIPPMPDLPHPPPALTRPRTAARRLVAAEHPRYAAALNRLAGTMSRSRCRRTQPPRGLPRARTISPMPGMKPLSTALTPSGER